MKIVSDSKNQMGILNITVFVFITIIASFSLSQVYALPIIYDDDYMVEKFVTGLEYPTTMIFVGEDILVLEKNTGKVIRIQDNGIIYNEPVLDVPVIFQGEGGLLGIAFASNHFYLFFTESLSGFDTFAHENVGRNVVYQYDWNGEKLTNPILIKEFPTTCLYINASCHHSGGITTGINNEIYFVIGDQYQRTIFQNIPIDTIYETDSQYLPQAKRNLSYETGSIFKIDTENNNSVELFAMGIRNSFGLDVDPVTGYLWETENGPDKFDELNLVKHRFNGGWISVLGPIDRPTTWYDTFERWHVNPDIDSDFANLSSFENFEYSDPEFSWYHTVGPTVISFPDKDSFRKYSDWLFVGDFHKGIIYKFQLNVDRTGFVFSNPELSDLVLDDNDKIDEILFAKNFLDVPNIANPLHYHKLGVTDIEFHDGAMYVVAIGDGSIYKIYPKNILPPLKQYQNDVTHKKIVCKTALMPIMSKSGYIYCVQPKTALTLIDVLNWSIDHPKMPKIELKNQDLQGLNFEYVNLSNSDLRGSNFYTAKISNVNFTRANLADTDLSGQDFTGTILTGASLIGVNLTNSNLTGVDLSGRDLTGAILRGMDLSGKDLTGTILAGINLSDMNLTGTILTGADLTNADLTGVNLSNKDLTGTILTGVDLSAMDLTGIILAGADLTDADLTGVDLSGRDLTGAILRGMDLSGKDLTGTILKGADLTNANLDGVDLSGRDLTGAILRGMDLSGKDLTGTILAGINLSDMNLTGTILTGADLTNADLTGVNLSNKDLTGTILTGVDLSAMDLTGIILAGADLTDADLTGVDLSGRDLTGAILRGMDLSGKDLTGTILKGADLTNANLDGVDLSGKDLSFASFHYTSFDNADMENTNLTGAELVQVDFTKIKNKSLAGTNLLDTSFAHSNLSGVNLSGSTLDANNFFNANLSGLDFSVISNTSMRGVIFPDANLSNANFEGVSLFDNIIYGITIEGDAGSADRSLTELTGRYFSEWKNKLVVGKQVIGNDLQIQFIYLTNFSNTNLQNANFSNADLRFSGFYEADLTNADLSGADLTKAFLGEADLYNANLDGAILDNAVLTCKNHPVCN